MANYPSAFSSLLQQKCPQCRKKHVFLKPTFSWRFLKMHKHCPQCDLNLNPEPGFYWGAMYISYGFNAGIAIVASLILYFLFNNPVMEVYIIVVLSASTLLGSVVIRYSRLMMLYGLGEAKFKPELFSKTVENVSEPGLLNKE